MKNRLCVLLLSLLLTPVMLNAAEDEVDYLDLAALMLRDGNLDRAVVALDQVDLSTDDVDLLRYYTLRGLAHIRRNEPAPAVDALRQAIAIGEVQSTLYVYLAQALFQLERYREVLDALDRGGEELVGIASIFHMRAQCHWLLDEPAMALAVLDQASERFPGEPGFLRRKVFFLIELGLFREAVQLGRQYLQQSEGRKDDYVAFGAALGAVGETDEALVLLEQARLKFPGDPEIGKVLARSYFNQGRINAAADLVLEASMADPTLVSEAAELYRRAGRTSRALMLNGQIADQPTKLKQRLAILLELQRFEQAATMDEELRRVGLLEDEDIRYALAYALFKAGDFQAAETHLQKLARPDLFRRAAELRRAMQDCAEEPWLCM
jgi:tetratricopeptide (TPR) repeat protein